MPPIERLSISLPAEMARMIRAKVEDGTYATVSEVIRESLRAWEEKERLHAERLASIRARIAEAEADPSPPLSQAEVTRHLEQRYATLMRVRKSDEGA